MAGDTLLATKCAFKGKVLRRSKPECYPRHSSKQWTAYYSKYLPSTIKFFDDRQTAGQLLAGGSEESWRPWCLRTNRWSKHLSFLDPFFSCESEAWLCNSFSQDTISHVLTQGGTMLETVA
jgi:hypothetical protein